MRRGDVAKVEGRVLPHQHDVRLRAEIEAHRFAEREVIADHPLHRHRMRARPDPAVAIVQVLRAVMEQPVAARLCGQHQREGRIARDVQALERVHLDGDGEWHGEPRMIRIGMGRT